jgi:hypothetical protein
MQATPYDFNNYPLVFKDMLTSFKAPIYVNTITLSTKAATIVNQTTIQKNSPSITKFVDNVTSTYRSN